MFVLVAVVKLSPKQNLIYEKIKKRDPPRAMTLTLRGICDHCCGCKAEVSSVRISYLSTTDALRHIIL